MSTTDSTTPVHSPIMLVAESSCRGALRIDRLVEEFGGDHTFYAYNEDCFDPYRYVVRGDSFEDAYENLLVCDRIERELDVRTWWGPAEVAEAEAAYASDNPPSGVEFNANGVLLDTESLVMFPCTVRGVRRDDDEWPSEWQSRSPAAQAVVDDLRSQLLAGEVPETGFDKLGYGLSNYPGDAADLESVRGPVCMACGRADTALDSDQHLCPACCPDCLLFGGTDAEYRALPNDMGGETLVWEVFDRTGSMIVVVPCDAHRQAEYASDDAECTSTDPSDHQGDTCPVHERGSATLAAVRSLAIMLAVVAGLLWLAAPIALRAHQERATCAVVPAAQLIGLDYRPDDDSWRSPGTGEVIGYAPTEDSVAYTLQGCPR